MEAAALPSPARIASRGISLPATLLRLRSDEQLVALFRAGSDEAFSVIHDRYRVRLMAYCRQMLGGSHADAEDVLQDVLVRAHAALRASDAPIALRAWLYRIAHNRCVDGLRRPAPLPSEIMPGAQPALSRGAHHDPPVEAERSEDLRRLVRDLLALPEQQRSALLMRELQGLTYEELASSLGVSVGAVKSLLVRARDGVASAAVAREAPCPEIRLALAAAHDRGVRPSGHARRHLRECAGCREHRLELRNTSRQLAGLVPPAGLLGQLGVMTGLGGGGGTGGGLMAAGGGAGGGLAGGGGALCGVAGAAAGKVAAIVCAAALVGGAGDALSSAPAGHPVPARAARPVARSVVPARRIVRPTPAVRARTVSVAALPVASACPPGPANVPVTIAGAAGPGAAAAGPAAAAALTPTGSRDPTTPSAAGSSAVPAPSPGTAAGSPTTAPTGATAPDPASTPGASSPSASSAPPAEAPATASAGLAPVSAPSPCPVPPATPAATSATALGAGPAAAAGHAIIATPARTAATGASGDAPTASVASPGQTSTVAGSSGSGSGGSPTGTAPAPSAGTVTATPAPAAGAGGSAPSGGGLPAGGAQGAPVGSP